MTADFQNQQKTQNPAQGAGQQSDPSKQGSAYDPKKTGYNPKQTQDESEAESKRNDPYKKTA